MNKPPADDLPIGTTSVDPTGGPQGPYFNTSFIEMNVVSSTITWQQLCQLNPHIWIDDEKRVDWIDMFGSLNTPITQGELIGYVDRISTDFTGKSIYGPDSKRPLSTYLQQYEKCAEPFTHYITNNVFSNHVTEQIQDTFSDNSSFNSEERQEIRSVVTLERVKYRDDNLTTSIIDTLVNTRTIHIMNKWFPHIDLTHPNILHLFRLVIDRPGYQNPAHMDKNNLLTTMVFFPETQDTHQLGTELLDDDMRFCKRVPYTHNSGYCMPCIPGCNTFHSYMKPIPEDTCRYSIMHNVYENEKQYMSIYDKNTRWDIINRARHKQEIEHNLFTNRELLHTRFDWSNSRAIEHRRNMSYRERFNKQQGCINYDVMSKSHVEELLIDQKLSTTGDIFEKTTRLKSARSTNTILAEKTWNPIKPSKYLKTQGSG